MRSGVLSNDQGPNLSRPADSPQGYQSTSARLYEYLENSTGPYVPPHLLRQLEQDERKHQDLSDIRLKCPEVNFSNLINHLDQDCMAKSFRHQIRQDLADYITDGSIAAKEYWKYEQIAGKLERARNTGAVGITPDGRSLSIWDDKVNCVRLCPDESREECQRLTRKYAPEILRLLNELQGSRLFYVVINPKNIAPDDLQEGKRQLFKDFSRFHRSALAKKSIKGSFVIQEDPLSKHENWNVHLNCLMVVQGDFNYKEIRDWWGCQVEIRQVKGSPEDIAKAFLEVVKYAAKHIGEKSEDGKHTVAPGLTSWPWERFNEWWEAGKGFRRSRSYGCLYRPEAAPEKGVSIDTVSWIGSISWETNGYQVNLKNSVRADLEVDLIQSDKFASDSMNYSDFSTGGRRKIPPIQNFQKTNTGYPAHGV